MSLTKKISFGAAIVGSLGLIGTGYNYLNVKSQKNEIAVDYKFSEVDNLNRLINNYPITQNCEGIKEYRDSLESIKGFSEARKNYERLESKNDKNKNWFIASFLIVLLGILSEKKD